MIFLDTNIILRYLTCDDPAKAKRCEDLLKKTVSGKEPLYTTALVIAEVVWTLEKAYKVPKKDVITYVQKILNTPNIEFDDKDTLLSAIGLYDLKKIDFIDAYNAAAMETQDIDTIYSYDADFDLIPNLKRLEP